MPAKPSAECWEKHRDGKGVNHMVKESSSWHRWSLTDTELCWESDNTAKATYWLFFFFFTKKSHILRENFNLFSPTQNRNGAIMLGLLLYCACRMQRCWIRLREGSISEWVPSILLHSLKGSLCWTFGAAFPKMCSLVNGASVLWRKAPAL